MGLLGECDTLSLFCVILVFNPQIDFPTFLISFQHFLVSWPTMFLVQMSVLNFRQFLTPSGTLASKIVNHYQDIF